MKEQDRQNLENCCLNNSRQDAYNGKNNILNHELSTYLKTPEYLKQVLVSAKQAHSPQITETMSRDEIVSALQVAALENLIRLINFLEEERNNDESLVFNPFWINSCISVIASSDTINKLATHPDVESIIPDVPQDVIDDDIEIIE